MSVFDGLRHKKWSGFGKNALLLLLGASLLASGCGGGKKSDSAGTGTKKGQILTIGTTNAPRTLNPVAATDTSSVFVMRMMYDTLLGEPEVNKFTNHLADSFETKDKQTYTIKLNPKAKWSDGKPITADDLVFSLNLVANPQVETYWCRYVNYLEGLKENGKFASGTTISGVVKKDDHTVEIKCKMPLDPNFVKDQLGANFLIFPKHVLENTAPGKLSSAKEGVKPTVFSGPFKLVKYVTNDHVELEANKDYFRGEPKLKKIFVKIQNSTNMVVDLKAGKIQMSAGGGIGKIPIKDIEILKKEKNLIVKNTPSTDSQMLEINNQNPENNKHFRLALAHAINRKQIVDQLYKGYSYINPTIYTKVSPVYDPSVPNPAYDVELAKKELAASGFDTNKEIALLVPIGNVPREQSADLIQQNLQAIGLKVKLEKMDFPTLISRERKGAYQILLRGIPLQANPDTGKVYEPGSTNNWSYVNDPKLTKMLAEARVESDSQKRIDDYKVIQRYLAENQFHIVLYGEEDFIIQAKNLVGGIKPYWYGSLDDVHLWHFE